MSREDIDKLKKKSLAELRKMQDAVSAQIKVASETGNKKALDKLQDWESELTIAVLEKEFDDNDNDPIVEEIVKENPEQMPFSNEQSRAIYEHALKIFERMDGANDDEIWLTAAKSEALKNNYFTAVEHVLRAAWYRGYHEGLVEIKENPMKHFHSARVLSPKSFREKAMKNGATFATKKLPGIDGVSIIVGIPKRKRKTAVQSYRFEGDVWTPSAARAWLKSQGVKYSSLSTATDASAEQTKANPSPSPPASVNKKVIAAYKKFWGETPDTVKAGRMKERSALIRLGKSVGIIKVAGDVNGVEKIRDFKVPSKSQLYWDFDNNGLLILPRRLTGKAIPEKGRAKKAAKVYKTFWGYEPEEILAGELKNTPVLVSLGDVIGSVKYQAKKHDDKHEFTYEHPLENKARAYYDIANDGLYIIGDYLTITKAGIEG